MFSTFLYAKLQYVTETESVTVCFLIFYKILLIHDFPYRGGTWKNI